MAVKKTLIEAIPSNEGGKVVRWSLTMKYEQGTEGEADYYKNNKQTTIDASETRSTPSGDETITNFTPKAEKDWSKSDLEALCPTTRWDAVFARQYDSVITNPSLNPEPNNDFVIPS